MNDDPRDIGGYFIIAKDAGVFEEKENDQQKIFEEDYGLDEETAERAVALMDEEGLDEDESAELAEWM